MKQFISKAIILTLLLSLFSIPVVARNNDIPVFLNNQSLTLSDPPIIKNGRTLAPMRGLFEALGASVGWDSKSQTAIGERDGITVRIPIGSTKPMVNGVTKEISVAAEIINGRTYIPLRFVGEALGDEVIWNATNRSVEINRKQTVNVYKPYSIEDANNILNVPSDYASIQDAINAANNGDAILIASGNYEENIDYYGKKIIITSTDGPKETTIHGGYKGCVVTMHNNETEDSVLHGFTITKGAAGLSEDGEESIIFPRGGGVSIFNSSPTISECIMEMNATTDFGGGVYISGEDSKPIINNNQIIENISHYQGAGISVDNGAKPTIINNTIANNFAEAATGIVITGKSAGLIENNIIKDNISGYDTNSELVFQYLRENPEFYNWVDDWGQHPAFPSGILVSQDSTPTIKNNQITGNDGGGIGVLHGSAPVIENNTITNNGNDSLGAITGGVMAAYDAKLILASNTITGNIGPAVWVDRRNSEVSDKSNTKINLPIGTSKTKISNNQISGDIVAWPYERPIINMTNNPRTINVPEDFTYIQDAINEANHGDTIIIAPGTYNQSIDYKGKSITIKSQDPSNEDVVKATILQGGDSNAPDNGQGPIVMFINGEGKQAKLEGLTLKNQDRDFFNMSAVYIESASPTITNNRITSKKGTAIVMNWAYTNLHMIDNAEDVGRFTSIEGYETAPHLEGNTIYDSKIGGGIWHYYASPTIVNNKFVNNNGRLSGAIHNWFSSALIQGNEFTNNSGEVGGALHFENFAIPNVINNTFYNNSADGGGAIHIDSPTYGTIDKNIFKNNQVSFSSVGSATSVGMLADISLTNNLITENYGWPVYAGGAKVTLTNNTLVNNWAEPGSNESQGAFAMGQGVIFGHNNIFYNSALNNYQKGGIGHILLENSLFYDADQGAWPGTGNFSANPRFIGEDDYRLSSNSPAIDAGVEVDLFVDILGNERPQGDGFDLGAYEFIQ